MGEETVEGRAGQRRAKRIRYGRKQRTKVGDEPKGVWDGMGTRRLQGKCSLIRKAKEREGKHGRHPGVGKVLGEESKHEGQGRQGEGLPRAAPA